jgi:hypothetical protein
MLFPDNFLQQAADISVSINAKSERSSAQRAGGAWRWA